MSTNELTKEEAIEAVEITKPDVALIELDKIPETAGKAGIIFRPDMNKSRQQNQAESGCIRKMYEPTLISKTRWTGSEEEGTLKEETYEELEDLSNTYWPKYKEGDRITFMDYAAPQGTFQKYPELRFIGLPDIIAKLKTKKPIVD